MKYTYIPAPIWCMGTSGEPDLRDLPRNVPILAIPPPGNMFEDHATSVSMQEGAPCDIFYHVLRPAMVSYGKLLHTIVILNFYSIDCGIRAYVLVNMVKFEQNSSLFHIWGTETPTIYHMYPVYDRPPKAPTCMLNVIFPTKKKPFTIQL